jgi:fructan beta-fructosidase
MTLAPRPQIHFTPMRNWINDPNGLIFYKGLYHLFFQYNPEGDQWGNMSWGHATSKDLYQWDEQPVAITYTPTHAVFSGSVVVDYFNTTGFGTSENPAMVAIFTEHQHDETRQFQSLAYSLDDGQTWQRYQANPILDLEMKNFRDPKVTWNRVNECWVMTVVKPHEETVCFYASDNLKEWRLLSEFSALGSAAGIWECPDLFSLSVDGDPSKTKWVLFISVNPGGVTSGSGTFYFIGDWNGKEFVPDDLVMRWLDYGRDNYAGVTFNDAPDNRRIYLGWMNNWEYADKIPANPYRGAMTVPRELSLVTKGSEVLLLQNPVKELVTTTVLDHTFVIKPKSGKSGLRFSRSDGSSVEIGYDADSKIIYLDRTAMWFNYSGAQIESAHFDSQGAEFSVRVIIDSSSIETFVSGGQLSITDLLAPGEIPTTIAAF